LSDFDKRQARIIRAWLSRSRDTASDAYDAFIGLWIAFNAYCYGRYARLAHRNRADLRNEAGLRSLSDAPTAAVGQIVREPSRVRLELTQPGRVVIVIRERYTEDIIFSQLAKDFRVTYLDWLKDIRFAAHVAAFHAALARNGRHYVVNMAVVDRYDPKNLDALANQGVIVPFEDPTKIDDLIDVLYQVRCNVFHGEKVPYDPNDDKIVKAAHPVLLFIVEKLAETLPKEENS
jgi:hypothetical protein